MGSTKLTEGPVLALEAFRVWGEVGEWRIGYVNNCNCVYHVCKREMPKITEIQVSGYTLRFPVKEVPTCEMTTQETEEQLGNKFFFVFFVPTCCLQLLG